MIAFFVVLGILAFVGLVAGLVLYVLDRPALDRRLRVEAEAQQAAWRIQLQTRRAVEQMLDAARAQRRHDQP